MKSEEEGPGSKGILEVVRFRAVLSNMTAISRKWHRAVEGRLVRTATCWKCKMHTRSPALKTKKVKNNNN